MTRQITAYICCKNSGGVDIEPPEKDAVVESDDQVIAYLQPVSPQAGCKNGVGEITAYIMASGDDQYCNQDTGLSWQRSTETGFNDYPVITFGTPEHCQWVQSNLKIFGPSRISEIHGQTEYIVMPGSGGGACPDDKDDVFSGGAEQNYTVTQNRIVPGMKIDLEHIYFDKNELTRTAVDAVFWCTSCISGGVVKAVIGSYGSTDIQYKVQICGQEMTCSPTDFVEYAVGDWVFVVKQGGSGDVGNEDCSSDGTYLITPLKINVDGA